MENINPPALGAAKGFSHATHAAGLFWLGAQVGTDFSGRIQNPSDMATRSSVIAHR